MNYLRQAEELAQFAQSTEVDTHAKNLGRDVVNVVEAPKDIKGKPKLNKFLERSDSRRCFLRGEAGHIRIICPQGKEKKSSCA